MNEWINEWIIVQGSYGRGMNDPGTGEEPRYGPRVGLKFKLFTVHSTGFLFVDLRLYGSLKDCIRQFQWPLQFV